MSFQCCIYRSIIFFKTTTRASKTLHDRMFSSILHAPMRFFDLNPSGRILNRFSRDMGLIDEIMPRIMMDAIQIFLVMIGILGVIVYVNPPMIVALSIAIFLFGCIIKLYLRPSQDLKRLEGICKCFCENIFIFFVIFLFVVEMITFFLINTFL